MTRAAWVVVAVVTLLRAAGAFALPLTGDEAYYWEWSRRLAGGYVDHPPAVAWIIAAFAPLGHAPGFVRLGFVACGVVATLAVAACAKTIWSDARAGAVAALALTLAPFSTVAFASASPDGPYLMCWALALWLGARAFKGDRTLDWIALGLALGGAVLSRILGIALLFGVLAYSLGAARRVCWRRGMPLALGAAFVACLPLLVWNASHEWITFSFALLHRHDVAREFSLPRVLAAEFAAYSPGLWLAALLVLVRPRNALLAWTALPLFALVTFLSFFESVEAYWVCGSFVSLCAMLGGVYLEVSERARRAWTIAAGAPAALLLALLFTFAFAPVGAYHVARAATGLRLRNGGPFEIMTYAPVAADAARLAGARNAIVMTDGYGFSSVMDFDAGVEPVVVGYNWQGRESHAWFPDARPAARALFVDKEPLDQRPDFVKHLGRACARVVDAGTRPYAVADTPPRNYYFTWCEGLRPEGLAILRWEREPSGG